MTRFYVKPSHSPHSMFVPLQKSNNKYNQRNTQRRVNTGMKLDAAGTVSFLTHKPRRKNSKDIKSTFLPYWCWRGVIILDMKLSFKQLCVMTIILFHEQ